MEADDKLSPSLLSLMESVQPLLGLAYPEVTFQYANRHDQTLLISWEHGPDWQEVETHIQAWQDQAIIDGGASADGRGNLYIFACGGPSPREDGPSLPVRA